MEVQPLRDWFVASVFAMTATMSSRGGSKVAVAIAWRTQKDLRRSFASLRAQKRAYAAIAATNYRLGIASNAQPRRGGRAHRSSQ